MAPADDFCGIDPDEMGTMAVSLRGAADRLAAFSEEFTFKLSRHGLSTPALTEITDIAAWGRTQVSMLDGRAELIQTLNAGGDLPPAPGGDPGLIYLPDELEGYKEAQGLALTYGKDIFVNFEGDFQAGLIHDHIADIEKLADNPHAAAAFFALLPPKIRASLPSLIAATGSKTAKQDLAAFSKVFGAALRAPGPVPAFTQVKTELLQPAENKVVAWNRLALLKNANAPSDIRSTAARTLVLDDFVTNPRQDWRAGSHVDTKAYGLPSDLAALGLEVLAGDGTAVRDAFSKMGRAKAKLTQAEKMKLFLDYAKTAGTGAEAAATFGHAMESGTEATTENPGRHTPEAAAFTLDLIRVAGTFGDDLPAPARESMAVIAKSYIHELASGARFDKAVDRTSGLDTPMYWQSRPGITPEFYLSPGDTYRFLQTFVGDKRLTNAFDAAAAQFRHDILKLAARMDAQDGSRQFENTAKVFGDLAGLELKATLDVRGEQDATDEVLLGITKNTIGFGVDAIPVAGDVVSAGWELAKAYGGNALLDNWGDSFETRVEEVTGARSNFVLRQKYDMAYVLHEAGYPTSKPPRELINGTTGNLKTYDELSAEAKAELGYGKKWEQALREKLVPYERWMDRNNNFDSKVENATDGQISEEAKEHLRLWR